METSLNVTAKPEDSKAKIQGLGNYEIKAGTTDIPITVTAEAGNVKVYTVHVTREANDNPYPNEIIVNGLVPSLCMADDSYCHIVNDQNIEMEFDKDTHTYYVTVPSRVKQLYFNIDPGHPYQQINGEGKVSLNGGENTLTITVLSEKATYEEDETKLVENVDYTVYNYVVVRDMTGNTDLSEFSIIDPVRDINYDPDITEYYVSIPNQYKTWQVNTNKKAEDFTCPEDAEDCEDVYKLQMYLETDDPNASFITNGPDELEVGLNSINVLVTAANGETKTYILNVYRERNENVYLKSLTIKDDKNNTYDLSPVFNKIFTGTYYATVPNDVSVINLDATSP